MDFDPRVMYVSSAACFVCPSDIPDNASPSEACKCLVFDTSDGVKSVIIFESRMAALAFIMNGPAKLKAFPVGGMERFVSILLELEKLGFENLAFMEADGARFFALKQFLAIVQAGSN